MCQNDEVFAHPPTGKIRLMGKEHGRPFFIGDFDADISPEELGRIKDEHRGVGIDFETVYPLDSDDPGEHD